MPLMKHKSSKIITIMLCYIIAIIGILIIQFRSGKTFSLNLGAISVAGRYELINGEMRPLLPIQVLANGISFFVSERSNLLAKTETETKELKIIAYSNTDTSFCIHCDHKISITFTYNKFGDIEVLTVSTELPTDVTSISIPWRISSNSKFEIKNAQSFIVHNKEKFTFEGDFGFNEQGIVDAKMDEPRLTLSKNSATALYKSYRETNEFRIERVATMKGSSKADYRAAKENFTTKALNIFTDQIKRKTYNEAVLTAYIAETAKRNMFVTALENAPARLLSKKDMTALSMPFYGNIINMYEKVLQEENLQRQSLSKLISERSLDVFSFENLISFLAERSSAVLISDLPIVLRENDLAKLTLPQAIGIVECYFEYAQYFPQDENFLETNLQTCFRKITDSLLILNDELYSVQKAANKSIVDTELTLRLVRVLLRIKDNTSWNAVAYKLYTSVSKLVGVDGSLVKIYQMNGDDTNRGLLVDDAVIFTAAQAYPLLAENSCYPSAKSLNSVQNGIWLYGSAKNIQVLDTRKNYFTFTIENEKSASEYFVVRNVYNLKNIIIHGLDYRSDPRFETYNSSGYVYNANTETLYLKLRHKTDVEKIILQME